jgi:hypothetical protein
MLSSQQSTSTVIAKLAMTQLCLMHLRLMHTALSCEQSVHQAQNRNKRADEAAYTITVVATAVPGVKYQSQVSRTAARTLLQVELTAVAIV